METEPVPQKSPPSQEISAPTTAVAAETNVGKVIGACVAAALVPGLGHALLKKWDRAVVFFVSIVLLFVLGLMLQARLFGPDFSDLFSILKFTADAGSGLLFWLPWFGGVGVGDPSAYAYDFGNVFVYAAGLLNMLLVVDAFDISMGRKQ